MVRIFAKLSEVILLQNKLYDAFFKQENGIIGDIFMKITNDWAGDTEGQRDQNREVNFQFESKDV